MKDCSDRSSPIERYNFSTSKLYSTFFNYEKNLDRPKKINKTKEFSSLTRLDLIELFMEKFEKKSNLLLDVDERSGKEEYSIKEYDYIRKSTMDDVAKAENGLHAYEAMQEILKETERTDLMEEIQLGIEYYQLILLLYHILYLRG